MCRSAPLVDLLPIEYEPWFMGLEKTGLNEIESKRHINSHESKIVTFTHTEERESFVRQT